jgi:hypothetical protein
MEEAPENGKESSHSARASGMNEWMDGWMNCKEMFYRYSSRLLKANYLSSSIRD